MIKEIIIGIVGSIIGSIITLGFTKIFWGFKHFKGVKKVARLNRDCFKSGIINVFPNRESYIEHKDHGKSVTYISKANHSVLYVGYWLATSTEIGEVKNTIKKLVQKQITVTIVFISPNDKATLEICSKYINVDSNTISNRVKYVLEDVLKFKNSLNENEARYLVIKVHKVPLSTTAFIIDYSQSKECKILLDYKVYDGSRESSYGIEYQDSEKTITKKVLESYISISNSAQEVKNPDEIDIV